jgi:DNA-binding YbaB/EbfC family protein
MPDDSDQNGPLNLVQMAQTIRENILKSKEEAHKKTSVASVGGGMVTVTANGLGRVVDIKIDPEVINPGDPEMLGDLILAAVNEALSQIENVMLKETRDATSKLDFSGLF